MAISFPISFSGVQSTANPLTKAYAAAVDVGDVLVAFVSIYNATETCTGVSDSVNGAWTQAFGPITNTDNGARVYGFYKLNSASGTPTVTANFSNTNHHEIAISRISGLAGGGAFDQSAGLAALSTNPSIGPTAALGAAVCAAVAMQTNSGVTPSAYGAGWTLDGNLNYGWQPTSYLRQVTSSNTALTASWTQANSFWAGGLMVFMDASTSTNYTLTLDTGSYTVSGHSITNPVALSIPLGTGSYGLTGQDIAFSLSTPGRYTLQLDTGVYTITGIVPNTDLSMALDTGTYTLNGKNVLLRSSNDVIVTAKTTTLAVALRLGL